MAKGCSREAIFDGQEMVETFRLSRVKRKGYVQVGDLVFTDKGALFIVPDMRAGHPRPSGFVRSPDQHLGRVPAIILINLIRWHMALRKMIKGGRIVAPSDDEPLARLLDAVGPAVTFPALPPEGANSFVIAFPRESISRVRRSGRYVEISTTEGRERPRFEFRADERAYQQLDERLASYQRA
jgi:hypothetical protein